MRSVQTSSWSPLAWLAAAIVVGCGDSVSPVGVMSGLWQNDTSLSTLKVPLEVRLTQRDTLIEGTGMYGGDVQQEVSVIGFYSSLPRSSTSPWSIVLTFAAVNTVPALFYGNLSTNGDTLAGVWKFGFVTLPQDSVIFIRQ